MKKLMTSALMLALLSGCGTHALVGTARIGANASAQSKAGVEKGIHAMFRAAFAAADKNEDKKLTLDEMPIALPVAPIPGTAPAAELDPAAIQQAQKDMLARLDFNRDGVVTYREFARPDDQAQAMIFYRTEVAKLFNSMDKNGDHVLTANEVAGAPLGPDGKPTFDMDFVDLNHNDKVTGSEFEDAFVRKFGQGADPVDPPAPAPAPVNPPAPAPDPAPAGDTPAPADQPS
jgi:Ca2+-binding EF-hand superfamily protein